MGHKLDIISKRTTSFMIADHQLKFSRTTRLNKQDRIAFPRTEGRNRMTFGHFASAIFHSITSPVSPFPSSHNLVQSGRQMEHGIYTTSRRHEGDIKEARAASTNVLGGGSLSRTRWIDAFLALGTWNIGRMKSDVCNEWVSCHRKSSLMETGGR